MPFPAHRRKSGVDDIKYNDLAGADNGYKRALPIVRDVPICFRFLVISLLVVNQLKRDGNNC